MFIVDSQVHIWKEETPDRPWVPGARERLKANGHQLEPFTYEECIELMDRDGVNRALIVPPSWEGDREDYALEACEKYPDRFGVMARIPQNKPNEAKAMLRDWKGIPHIKGTRLTFHRPIDRNWMIDGTCNWYWSFAEEHNIKTMVHAPFWKAELGAIAKRHPGLRLIIDHMGILTRSVDDSISHWVEETAALHVHPNIYVKVSAIPGYSTHPFPYENVNHYVRDMVRKMGPERCFWGTDITRLMHNKGLTYKDTIEHFTTHLGLSADELSWIMGRGICQCLEWPIPEPAQSERSAGMPHSAAAH
jgi:predicted TIM-barrel fold metal-dependent hydrolase